MGFLDDLIKGLPGLRLAIPEGWRRQDEHERRAVLIDSAHRVGWHILHAPWRADLRREHTELLRRDIERHARYGFEQHYTQVPQPAPGQAQAQPRPPVRTSDPTWSPVISVEHVEIGGQPALLTIRRVAYEPTIEAVVGNLLIPLATGLIDITIFQHTQDTGYRESALLNLALQKYPGETPQKLARRLGQAYFDEPAHDAQFPNHPLSCVRAAVRWLLLLPKEQFEITAPAAPLPPVGAEVELRAVGCAVSVPPRYVPVPEGVLPVPMGVSLLSRVILEGADDPQMLDVRQLSGASLPTEGRMERLQALVKRQTEEWQQQGATEIELKQTPVELPSDGADPGAALRVALAVDVSMMLGGVRTHTVSRWLVDHDGRVFRIGVATPPYVPLAEAAAEADAVLRSFRRLAAKKPAAVAGAWLTSDLHLPPLKRAEPA